MFRKIMILLLLAVMLTGTVCAAAGEAVTGSEPGTVRCGSYSIEGDIYFGPVYAYEVLPDGTARITGFYGELREIYIPETVDGCPVSTIGKGAIPDYARQDILTVHIPDCVTAIEQDAFENVHTALRFELSEIHPTLRVVDDVLISPAEKRIIRGWIRGEYSIPDGIEQLDAHAFWGSSCRSIHIPGSVAKLSRNPFAGVNTTMDSRMALQEVTLSPDNTALEIRDGVLFSKEDRRLVWCWSWNPPDPDFDSYAIPDDIEIIDDCAFWRWRKLRFITVPAGVKSAGIAPLPDRETEIRLDGNNEALYMEDGMLISREDKRLVMMTLTDAETVFVPDGINTIGDYAFYGLNNTFYQKTILPDTVSRIGTYAFAGYGGNVSIPAGVREIGSGAFAYCQGLTDLPAFSGGIRIGTNAFSECTAEELIVEGGAEIGAYAFLSCPNLRTVTIGEGASYIMPLAFGNCGKLETASFGEGLVCLSNGALRQCNSLEKVSLPSTLLYIGEQALYNMTTQEYSEQFSMYYSVYSSTVHASVPAGSFAEQFCEENGIEYSTDNN